MSAETLRRLRRLLPPLTALAVLAAVLWWTRSVYTDLLWFENLGYTAVYAKLLLFKTALFVGGAAVAGIALTLNVHLAWSISQGPSTLGFPENFLRLMRVSALLSAGLAALIGGIVFGVVASGRWETFLLVFNRIPFGRLDPLFGLDASFYVVTLRLFHFLQGWLLGLAVTMIVLTATLYIASYSIRGAGFIPAPRMLRHAAALGVFLMLAIAAGHVFDVFELVLSDNGVVSGATYTDIHARIRPSGCSPASQCCRRQASASAATSAAPADGRGLQPLGNRHPAGGPGLSIHVSEVPGRPQRVRP